MADGSSETGAKRRGQPATVGVEGPATKAPTLELSADDMLHQQLPANLPAEMFTGPGLLALADLLPVMTGYMDGEQRLQFVNQAMAEFLGGPRKAIVGRTMEDVIGASSYERRRPMIEAGFTGERQFFVAEFDHPARGALVLQTEYIPWVRSGTVSGLVFVVQDVTEQRTAERALRESEERFRRIANSAPVMMWVTRLDRVRDFVNDHYVEFVGGAGSSREEVRTIDWRGRIHPDDVDRIVAESLAGEATLQAFTLEGRYKRADGEYRWLRSVSQPRLGPDGDLVGFIGVASDITSAKEAELDLRRKVAEQTAELARSESQFRAIFDTVLEVIVLLKTDGTIVEMNQTKAPWRDPDPRRAIGKKVWDSPTLQNYPQHIALMKQAVAAAAKGEPFRTEVRMEREGVPAAYLDYSMAPIRDASGKIVYLLTEARDITELKAAQEQLRQSQKMEALGQLTGGMAHDFNNLLTVVVGGLDIITKRATDAKLKRYADNALAAAERGARLTGQLLAFSRVQRLEVKPTHVAPLIQNMRALLRNVLGPGITKQFELDEAIMPVMADPTQLEVAILNLAINARDAMPDGGVLTFSTAAVVVERDAELEDGDYVALTISDTGSGMPPEVIERAFEPFFTTKEVGKGTGLGLSMVYGMARQSGGTARIESAPDKGTAVTLLFRTASAAPPDPKPAEEAVAPAAAAEPLTVLVIDDDPDVRDFIATALEEQGYQVIPASDGDDGVEQFERARPDLVIVDFIMPGLSGADVARQIRAKVADQPILFVSGYSETDAVKRTAPDAPLLTKPFRADALHKAVRGALPPRS